VACRQERSKVCAIAGRFHSRSITPLPNRTGRCGSAHFTDAYSGAELMQFELLGGRYRVPVFKARATGACRNTSVEICSSDKFFANSNNDPQPLGLLITNE